MKKIILFISFYVFAECHGMQQLARHVATVTRIGMRSCANKPHHQDGFGDRLRVALGIGAGIGGAVGGIWGFTAGALSDDEPFIEAPLFGMFGVTAGAMVGGSWPITVPLIVGTTVYSIRKDMKEQR